MPPTRKSDRLAGKEAPDIQPTNSRGRKPQRIRVSKKPIQVQQSARPATRAAARTAKPGAKPSLPSQQTSKYKPKPSKRTRKQSSHQEIRTRRDSGTEQNSIKTWVDQTIENNIQKPSLASDDSRSEYNSEIAEIAEFYRDSGYVVPEMESVTHTSALSSKNGSRTGLRGPRMKADNPKYYTGLLLRNCDMKKPRVDPRDEQIKQKILATCSLKLAANEEELWKYDMLKCQEENEPVFQRTVMMHIIGRGNLGDLLDYTCESLWNCEPVPQKRYPGQVNLPRPKPDLFVGFREDQLISRLANISLGEFRPYMFPENVPKETSQRAFPFFSIEAKGVQGDVMDSVANRQNWNTASQALHNIYVFMKIAGAAHERAFFKEVRFFSATASSVRFKVRIHRGVLAEVNERIHDDYPLAFAFEEIFIADGNQYNYRTAAGIVRNIFVEYGVGILLPLLKKAVQDIQLKLKNPISQNEALDLLNKLRGVYVHPQGTKRPAENVPVSSAQRQRTGDMQE